MKIYFLTKPPSTLNSLSIYVIHFIQVEISSFKIYNATSSNMEKGDKFSNCPFKVHLQWNCTFYLGENTIHNFILLLHTEHSYLIEGNKTFFSKNISLTLHKQLKNKTIQKSLLMLFINFFLYLNKYSCNSLFYHTVYLKILY